MNSRDERGRDVTIGASGVDLPTGDVFHASYDPEEERSLNNAVIDGVAAVTGKRPTDLPPLHDDVDTDALEAIFARSADADADRPMTLSFPYAGHYVVVRDDGTITIISDEDGI